MPLLNAIKDVMLDAGASGDAPAVHVSHLSLHDAAPGSAGDNELDGGDPAYARQAVAWNAASGGEVTNSNSPVFDVPAGADVAFVGMWSAAVGGTFLGYQSVTLESFGAQGTYTVTSGSIALNDPA